MTQTQAPATEPSIWTTIRESLAGSHHGSYTEGSINRAIVLLAIPMVLELVLESVFAVVDVFFVSRVGPDAVATVGLTEAMMTMIYAVAMGLGMGATATVARRMGEKDPEGAAIAAVQAIALGLLVAVPVGVLGFWFARPILALMGATPDVLVHSSFTAILFGFNGVILMLFLINAVFRGAGDAAIAMRVLWIANAINICLDPCLIFGLGPFPRLGVTGAAVATTTGRGIGVLVQLYFLSRSDGRIVIRRRHLRLNPSVMLNMVRLSGSAVFQMFIGTTSYIGVDAHHRVVRQHSGGGLHHRDPHHHVRADAVLGTVERGRDSGRAESGRRSAGAGGNVGLARVLVQRRGARRARDPVRRRSPTSSSAGSRSDPGGRADRDAGPSHHQRRLPVLCRRLRSHAVVQRRGRHLDADVDQPRLLLAVRNPAGVHPRPNARLWAAGHLLGDGGGVFRHVDGERVAIQAGNVGS